MANTEQIEAKLCAYVDGELDAAGRAEIEQHLAANPQHRQLLAELREQRNLLRELPREKAPEDLFDSFQTQLERSVLLDANRPAAIGRRNRTSQFLALAAILVLTIGLAAVIVFVLPDKGKHREYSVIPPTSAPATIDLAPAAAPSGSAAPASTAAPSGAPARTLPDSIAESIGGSLDESKSDKLAVGTAMPTTHATAAAPPLEIAGKAARADRKLDINGKDAPAAESSLAQAAPTAPMDADIADRVKRSSQVPENSMVVVVATANPMAIDQQVTGYLAMNNIRWEDVAQPTAPAAAPEAGVLGNKKGEAQQSPPLPGSRPTTQPSAAYALKDTGDVLQSSALAVVPPAPPSSQQQKEADKLPAAQQIAQSQPSQQSKQAQAEQSQLATSPSRYIVARGLTQSQLGELYGCIAAQNAGTIANYRRSKGTITPTTLPIALAMQHQTPSTQSAVQSKQNFAFAGELTNGAVGGGGARDRQREMDQAQKQSSTPTTAAAIGAASAKVANSPLPTTANSFGQAALHTAAPTIAPTTQAAPAVTDIAAAAIAALPTASAATTAPTSQAVTSALVPQLLAGRGVTTAPSTQPGEERVDVVIVVKSTVPDVSAPTPGTAGPVASEVRAMPASAPAAQPAPPPILKARRP